MIHRGIDCDMLSLSCQLCALPWELLSGLHGLQDTRAPPEDLRKLGATHGLVRNRPASLKRALSHRDYAPHIANSVSSRIVDS